jgi:hypothetical protein
LENWQIDSSAKKWRIISQKTRNVWTAAGILDISD